MGLKNLPYYCHARGRFFGPQTQEQQSFAINGLVEISRPECVFLLIVISIIVLIVILILISVSVLICSYFMRDRRACPLYLLSRSPGFGNNRDKRYKRYKQAELTVFA
jgi:hypothetical protein